MAYTGERVGHYIKQNEQTRVPRRHIFLHTVARDRRTHNGSLKTWYAACATFRVAQKGRKATERTTMFTDPDDLWEAVAAHCVRGARTVLWAHNLGYDVRLADALHTLPRLGWRLTAHNLAPKGTWMVWDRDGITLTMVDSASVFPKLLHQVGSVFGLNIPVAGPDKETDGSLLARAKAGELIVRTAITSYLQWIDDGDLGNWQFTGAGQSYATFRHKFLTHKMLVHEDVDALAMERRAMWTGRCEAYWHGTLTRQVVHEYDFVSAYASICATVSLPIRLVGPMPPNYPWRRVLTDSKVALLASVTITTSVPVVPCLSDGRILWPVGTFETTLWDVEIQEAILNGAEVTVHSGYLYRTAPALQAWAEWILSALKADDSVVPAWQKIIIKHWSTACPGRFAMAYPAWEDFGSGSKIGVDRRRVIDSDTGESYEMLQVGRDVFKQGGITEWGQSQPAITGYVMAVARVRLWRVTQALPAEAVLYADTDSIIVTDQWAKQVHDLAATPIGAGLRLKKSWDGFSIFGPRQIVTGQQVRVAGVPSSARRVGKMAFEGQVWESLPVSMGNHRADRILLRDRMWQAKCVDRRRKGPSLGWTAPYEIGTA